MSSDDQITVFVLGLDDKNLAVLQDVPGAERYRFLPLLSKPQLQEGEIPIADLLEEAQQKLDCFESRIDAIVGYWDFPVSTMVPILCHRFGLRSASLNAIVRCEHKYSSRLEQQKVIDEVPRFGLVDLEGTARVPEGLRYPLWLKPVKSASSELAFHVKDDAEFDSAVAAIREGVGRIGSPFDYVLTQVDLPPEIAAVGGQACLAEEEMSGVQVATEGYVFEGRIEVYGVLDSIDYPDSPCFLRHQYPSQLPPQVQQRLREISQRVIAQMGLDNSTFSVEFFYDRETDRITLLEINPRHSQAHAELFKNVDGFPNHHVMLSLALGHDPQLPSGKGPYAIAARYYHRRFQDGVVRRVPTATEIDRVQREIPGVVIRPEVDEGKRLSDLSLQDSYSYELTDIVIGARDEAELVDKYERTVAALRYEFDD